MQVSGLGTALAALLAGMVVAVVLVPGATVGFGATVVADRTLVVAGGDVTGTTVAGGSLSGGVVVEEAATW